GIRDRNVTGVQTCALPISITNQFSIFIGLQPRDYILGLPLDSIIRESGEKSGLRGIAGVTGRMSLSVVPPGPLDSIFTSPPWSRTAFRTTASPSPVPATLP